MWEERFTTQGNFYANDGVNESVWRPGCCSVIRNLIGLPFIGLKLVITFFYVAMCTPVCCGVDDVITVPKEWDMYIDKNPNAILSSPWCTPAIGRSLELFWDKAAAVNAVFVGPGSSLSGLAQLKTLSRISRNHSGSRICMFWFCEDYFEARTIVRLYCEEKAPKMQNTNNFLFLPDVELRHFSRLVSLIKSNQKTSVDYLMPCIRACRWDVPRCFDYLDNFGHLTLARGKHKAAMKIGVIGDPSFAARISHDIYVRSKFRSISRTSQDAGLENSNSVSIEVKCLVL